MANCILCKTILSKDTKPEHILMNALGGRKTTKNALCSDCNNAMGIGPDQDLAETVRPIRNTANYVAGDGDAAPPIHNIDGEGARFKLLAGAIPVLQPKQGLKIEDLHDGSINISISARDEKQLLQLVEGAIRQLKLNKKQADWFRSNAEKSAVLHSYPSPRFHHEIPFGRAESQRSMAKACLVLWAELVGTGEIQHDRYDRIRNFILDGKIPDAGPDIVNLDTRPLPEITKKFGLNPNLVWVGSDISGQVSGYFRLYGTVGWSILLCESGGPTAKKIGLISNPEEPKAWQCDKEIGDFLPFDWVISERDEPDYEAVRNSLGKLLKLAYQKSERAMAFQIVDDVCNELGLEEDVELSPQDLEKFENLISHRMTFALLKKPYTSPIKLDH